MGREIRQTQLVLLTSAANFLGTAALALAGWYGWGDYNWKAIGLLVIGIVLLGVTPLSTALFTIRSEAASVKQEAQENALSSLVELTHQLCDMPAQCDLRVTLMVIKQNSPVAHLVQLARHGCQGKQTPGKSTMTIHQGVAGLALRKIEGQVESLLVNIDVSNFAKEMVELGFTKEQAKQFNERGAYLCAPVVNSTGDAIAVLCLDTAESNVFAPVHTAVAERMTPFFSRFLTAIEQSEVEHVH